MKNYKLSANAHLKRLIKINKTMDEKNGFYKRGEYQSLLKKKLYHTECATLIKQYKTTLSDRTKKRIWKSIDTDPYNY